jgi:phosphoglycolate phosphatase
MPCQAVLFDLDGTLLDTIDDLADAANAALAAMGFPPHSVATYKLLVGDGIEALIHRVLGEAASDPKTVARGIELTRNEYALRWAIKTRPYPGVVDLLDELARRGVPMGVISNKPDDFTRLCVARHLPGDHFAVVQGATPELAKKPDPRGALDVAAKIGVAPADVLYLGDTNTDMQTAVAAGMFPVGALWGFRTAEELLENGAAKLVHSPLDVLRFL